MAGRDQIVNACSGLRTHRQNYLKMLEFANKNFFKINSLPLLYILVHFQLIKMPSF
jgi:hypothetical protein